MNFNLEKNAPRKIDQTKLKEGFSEKQTQRIIYECMLLQTDPQHLLALAPHLFNENVTASNTIVPEEPKIPEPEYIIPTPYTSYDDGDDYSYYST